MNCIYTRSNIIMYTYNSFLISILKCSDFSVNLRACIRYRIYCFVQYINTLYIIHILHFRITQTYGYLILYTMRS